MSETIFLRLLSPEDKASALGEAIDSLCNGQHSPVAYAINPTSFRQVPSSPFSYWVSERLRKLFSELPAFESEGRVVRQGGVTGDDFRYVRAYWEVLPTNSQKVGVAWVPFSKGGKFSPYWQDLPLVHLGRKGSMIRSVRCTST